MSKFAPVLRSLARQPLPRQALPLRTARYTPVAVRAFHSTTPQRNAALGQPHLLPEFSLRDKVIVVSGGARGLGLVQTEALLEAGATGESAWHGVLYHTSLTACQSMPLIGCPRQPTTPPLVSPRSPNGHKRSLAPPSHTTSPT